MFGRLGRVHVGQYAREAGETTAAGGREGVGNRLGEREKREWERKKPY